MATQPTTREERGEAIAKLPNQIKRIDDNNYTVKSQTNSHEYKVFNVNDAWFCECPDHVYRNQKCKHIFAVEFSKSLRENVAITRIIPELTIHSCQYCGSESIVRDSVRHNKSGDIQRYLCKTCGKRFSINLGFQKMKASPKTITSAMQLYFTGESYRNVQKFLKLQGVTVDHSTILRWVKKYVRLMERYLEKIKPNVSDTWRADELYVKIKGNMKYLFALLDDETRFWIAQEVAETKHGHDARKLFQMGMKVAGKKPKTLITDGLRAYQDAYYSEFYSFKEGWQEHIHKIALTEKHNNNKMERFNGEVRDREKVMRGLKVKETPILKGYQLFHNYIRPHEALEGRTPSEACGITIEGQNKWITLIQNASKKEKQE
jgi:transposase-like protein